MLGHNIGTEAGITSYSVVISRQRQIKVNLWLITVSRLIWNLRKKEKSGALGDVEWLNIFCFLIDTPLTLWNAGCIFLLYKFTKRNYVLVIWLKHYLLLLLLRFSVCFVCVCERDVISRSLRDPRSTSKHSSNFAAPGGRCNTYDV